MSSVLFDESGDGNCHTVLFRVTPCLVIDTVDYAVLGHTNLDRIVTLKQWVSLLAEWKGRLSRDYFRKRSH